MKKPKTPNEVIDFIGSNFNSMRTHGAAGVVLPLDLVTYSLTVHDILSAFEWAEDGADDTPNVELTAGNGAKERVMSDEAKPAVGCQVERRVVPLAWVVFAPNGNVRLWSQESEPARKFAEEQSLQLVPLYEIPEGFQLAPQEQTPEMERAGVDNEADSCGIARQIYRAMLAAVKER